jgi:hypothetical protein
LLSHATCTAYTLVAAVAKHLTVLQQIPDFLTYLHVDASCASAAPSRVCDGRGGGLYTLS